MMFSKTFKMQAAIILIAGLMQSVASADDLESLLEGKTKDSTSGKVVQVSREQSFLVDTLRSLQEERITSDQNIFFRTLEESNWSKALLQYPAAFAGTKFEKSENGRALLTLLQYKSGLTATGLESLLTIENPKKIHFHLLNLFKESAPENHPVWTVAQIKWTQAWSEVFGLAFEIRTQVRDISYTRGIDELKNLSLRAPTDSPEKALVDWHLALAYALQDKSDLAAKIMAGLNKAKLRPVSEELLNLTAARLLFQNGYFDAAIKYYSKVGKASDYWLDAQEEMAWSYIRKGEPQNSLAITQTLVNPIFKNQVGAETYFVRALSQLKICDYAGVLKSLDDFKNQFKDRTAMMKSLSENPSSESVIHAIDKIKKTAKLNSINLQMTDFGTDANRLPRYTARDRKLSQLALAQSELERESKVAEGIYADSLMISGLQSQFELLKKKLLLRAQMAGSATLSRVQELAKTELAENRKILAKMHIIEAEVIQQTSLAQQLAKNQTNKKLDVKVGSTGSNNKETMTFVGEQDVWFDELSNYRIDVKKACQTRSKE